MELENRNGFREQVRGTRRGLRIGEGHRDGFRE